MGQVPLVDRISGVTERLLGLWFSNGTPKAGSIKAKTAMFIIVSENMPSGFECDLVKV